MTLIDYLASRNWQILDDNPGTLWAESPNGALSVRRLAPGPHWRINAFRNGGEPLSDAIFHHAPDRAVIAYIQQL